MVVCYVVDVVPEGDPEIGLAGVLRYLLESVYAVGHVVFLFPRSSRDDLIAMTERIEREGCVPSVH